MELLQLKHKVAELILSPQWGFWGQGGLGGCSLRGCSLRGCSLLPQRLSLLHTLTHATKGCSVGMENHQSTYLSVSHSHFCKVTAGVSRPCCLTKTSPSPYVAHTGSKEFAQGC